MKYSIAIRTLGTSGEKFVAELESIKRQTIQPEKVIIYIAEGYERPDYTIGKEEYVWVKKGMMRQRVLCYDEIDTPLILLLDDDVRLSDNCVEQMMKCLEELNLDCIAAETFRNYMMPLFGKLYAAVTNFNFPHWSKVWGVKVHRNGSFSYNNNIKKDVYLTQSAAGPCALWRKQAFLDMHFEDELWLEELGFAFGEDILMFNKLHKNGYRLGTHYTCGVEHLNGQSSSGAFKRNLRRFHTRSMAYFMIWHRSCYNLNGASAVSKFLAALGFGFKSIWLLLIHIISSFYFRSPKVVGYYILGLRDGFKKIRSKEYRQLPNYILK